ncbi:hypothetical protein HanIR_Chr01g0045721 [Helianthus annuus]|nr:hypothetical protein HanIR_Chr01g0045721 [Helianthus annuus]
MSHLQTLLFVLQLHPLHLHPLPLLPHTFCQILNHRAQFATKLSNHTLMPTILLHSTSFPLA